MARTHILTTHMARELLSFRSPEDSIQTTEEELRNAGRNPETFASLQGKALAVEGIGDRTFALVLPKLKPYAPGPGLDHMIFVAKEGGAIEHLGDLGPHQLAHILTMAKTLEEVYRTHAATENPIRRKVVSVNYHADPLPEQALAKKLHAQTLRDLHVHVGAFRESDLDVEQLSREDLSRQEWRDIHDPFLQVIDLLARNEIIRKVLTDDMRVLRMDPSSELHGLTFRTETAHDTAALSSDLIELHRRFLKLYEDIAGCFVDSNVRDAVGMPVLHAFEERERRLSEFLESLVTGWEQQEDRMRLQTFLRRVNRLLISGEKIRDDPRAANERTVFLRGPAYTLSLLGEPHTANWSVNLSPRILSTGNLLASLGLHKVVRGTAPDTWMMERKDVEADIRRRYSDNTNARET